jgi:DNA-binding MarR family transcriptional regulator
LLARHYDMAMAEANLKSTQFTLLTHVKNYGPIALSELSSLMAIEPSTLTRNVQLVIQNGWASQESGADERHKFIAITAKGEKKQAQAKTLWEKQQQRIIDTLGVKQTKALNRMLDEAMAHLQAAEKGV